MNSSDTYADLTLQNQVNGAEKIFMNISIPFNKSEQTFGVVSGISERYMCPICFKFLLSKNRLIENEELRQKLILSKEEIKNIRDLNIFIFNRSC